MFQGITPQHQQLLNMAAVYWAFVSLVLTLSGFYAGQSYVMNKEFAFSTKDLDRKEGSGDDFTFAASYENADASKSLIPKLQNQTFVKSESPSIGPSPEEKMIEYFSSRTCHASKAAPPEEWLKRMIIQIGVQKGGTKAMHTFLEEDPQFVPRCSEEYATIELNYFNYNATVEAGFEEPMDQQSLQATYASTIKEACPLAVETLSNKSSTMYLDDSPLYMQDSDSIPQLLNCVVPWAKILAILRNPTDRAFSHYNFYLERDWCTDMTFDELIDENIKDLADAGVLDAKDEYEELLAWRHYNELHRNDRRCRTFVTRGLYAIQILHYIIGLQAAGRPISDLVAVHSNDLKGPRRQETYDRVLKTVGLQPHTLAHEASVHKTVYKESINEETRAKLDKFYKPYNDRLYKMLGWDPVWD